MNKWLIPISCLLASSAFAQTPNTDKNGERRTPPSAEEAFKRRDADQDGFLSKTEINGSRVADRFDQLDGDKDGKLSLDEYKAGRAKMKTGAGKREASNS